MKTVKIIVITCLFLMQGMILVAENENMNSLNTSVTVKGVVLDKDTQEKLPGVNLMIEENGTKAYSDPEGNFNLVGLSPGVYQIKVSCISYQERTLTLHVERDQNEKISIALETVKP